jgi:hypothetical protein
LPWKNQLGLLLSGRRFIETFYKGLGDQITKTKTAEIKSMEPPVSNETFTILCIKIN